MTDRRIPAVYAHRGASAECPQNTLDAFIGARNRGADGVELDVRRTMDGRLAVHHDPRLADGRVIVQTPSSELPEEVPSLESALEACRGMGVNIELKNLPGEPDFDPESQLADVAARIVQDTGSVDRVIVSSFNYADLTRMRQLDDSIATGWLVLDMVDLDAMLTSLTNDGHQALHTPAARTSAETVEAIHARGVRVNTWTVDDPALLSELAGHGVDMVITNDPAATRNTLNRWALGE